MILRHNCLIWAQIIGGLCQEVTRKVSSISVLSQNQRVIKTNSLGISTCIQEFIYCCIFYGNWSGQCNFISDSRFEEIHSLYQFSPTYLYNDLNMVTFARSRKVVEHGFINRHEEDMKKSKDEKIRTKLYFLSIKK